ncbi:MAG: metallophosphoesterase [Armatimonadota bacterium]|nr:metallophosphoesterase [Armatimonadota bacterium]
MRTVTWVAVAAALGVGYTGVAAPGTEVQGVVVAAAGDVACDPTHRPRAGECADAETARLLEGADLVLMLGDGQYPDGALERYQNGYGRTWGRYRGRTRPVPGNHEYQTPGAAGYFAYFEDLAGPAGLGYYAFEAGGWLLLALNSNCWAVGGCGPGSPQFGWLTDRLSGPRGRCVLAYWHHPLFSAGRYSGYEPVRPWWELLYRHGAAVVLTGHDHNYQRFPPLDGEGRPSGRGIRQFVVGTGGRNLYRAHRQAAVQPEVLRDDRFGVLRLRLLPGRYEWAFVATDGATLDHGASLCPVPGTGTWNQYQEPGPGTRASGCPVPGTGTRNASGGREPRRGGTGTYPGPAQDHGASLPGTWNRYQEHPGGRRWVRWEWCLT